MFARVATSPARKVVVFLLALCLGASFVAVPGAGAAEYDRQESQVVIHAPALVAGAGSSLSDSMRDRLRERVGDSAKATGVSLGIRPAPTPELIPGRWDDQVGPPRTKVAKAIPIRAPPIQPHSHS